MKVHILSLWPIQLVLRMIAYWNEFQKESELILLKFFSYLNLQIPIFINLLQTIVFWRIVYLCHFIFFITYQWLFLFIMIVIMSFFLSFFLSYRLFFFHLLLFLFFLTFRFLFISLGFFIHFSFLVLYFFYFFW